MQFCDNCGKLLLPKKKGKKKVLVCAKCGNEYEIDSKETYEVEQEVTHKTSELGEVITIDEDSEMSEEEIEARRERFIEGIDFFETE